jgi:hypothetical protein
MSQHRLLFNNDKIFIYICGVSAVLNLKLTFFQKKKEKKKISIILYFFKKKKKNKYKQRNAKTNRPSKQRKTNRR